MLDTALLDDLRLVVTELVTNSLEHVTDDASPIGLILEVADTLVHVEVRDAGPGFTPSKPQPSKHATRARGLAIVDELADRWGVISGPPHKVWYDIDHQRGTRPADAAGAGQDIAARQHGHLPQAASRRRTSSTAAGTVRDSDRRQASDSRCALWADVRHTSVSWSATICARICREPWVLARARVGNVVLQPGAGQATL